MTEVLTIILVGLVILACLAAFFLVFDVFFQRRVERIQSLVDLSPGRSFLIGLINAMFFGVVILVLASLNEQTKVDFFQGINIILLVAASILLIFGLAGIIRLVGVRIKPEAGRNAQIIWGSLAVGAGSALPFVGWFGLLPFLAVLGLGASIRSLFSTRQKSKPEIIE